MKKIYFLFISAALWLLVWSSPCRAAVDHSFLTSYEGSKTCRACHEETVEQVTHVLHYRMLGQPQGVYDFLTNKLVEGEHGKGNRY